jgi:citrate synthase
MGLTKQETTDKRARNEVEERVADKEEVEWQRGEQTAGERVQGEPDFIAMSALPLPHSLGAAYVEFIPMFATARALGWTAEILDQHRNNRPICPPTVYAGPRDRTWTGITERESAFFRGSTSSAIA